MIFPWHPQDLSNIIPLLSNIIPLLLGYSHHIPMIFPPFRSPFRTWIQLTSAQGVALLCRLDLGTADATGERPNGAHVRHHARPDAFSKPMGPTWVEKIWDKHMG
jgi:hypothetical protein